MTEPSPYEQGFRDALLSMKASLEASEIAQAMPDGTLSFRTVASRMREFEDNLDTLLDQKNHDLWSVLALAQINTSVEHYDPIVLRGLLHAPNGILIDTAGRMLYARLNGAEYSSGVGELLAENARLTAEVTALAKELGVWHDSDSER